MHRAARAAVYDAGRVRTREREPANGRPDTPPDGRTQVETIVSDSSGARIGALSVLASGATALARSASLDAALRTLLDAGCAATGAAVAAVFAQDPERGELELLAARGMDGDAIDAFAAEVAGDPEHPVRRAAQDRTESLGRHVPAPDGGAMNAVDLPLTVARSGIDEPVGIVSFGWQGAHQIAADEASLLRAVADLIAVALDGARMASAAAERAEWFERMAHSDPLTGLSNARTVNRVLELEVMRATRQGTEVSVAVFDIEGFGATNAAIGTRGGDRILREVAAVLAESVRLVDTIARTGGDEFVLVAPGSAGVTVARRVMDGIAKLDAIDGHRIALSAGVARFPADADDVDSLLDAARAALGQARTAQTPIAEAAARSAS